MASSAFKDFDAYEKGVVARALLDVMIKRGCLEERQEGDEHECEIVIPVGQDELRLLAIFSDDVLTERQLLMEDLRYLR